MKMHIRQVPRLLGVMIGPTLEADDDGNSPQLPRPTGLAHSDSLVTKSDHSASRIFSFGKG